MQLNSFSMTSELDRMLNVTVGISQEELLRNDNKNNMLAIILDRVVEKMSDKIIEAHGESILQGIDTDGQIQDKIREEFAKTVLRKVLA